MIETPESLRKTLNLYRGLVEVSGLIASITNFEELLRAILEVARKVIHAEGASLFLADEATGSLEMVAASHDNGKFERVRLVVPPGRGVSGWVFANGQAVSIPDAYEDPRFYREADRKTGFRTRSMLCAPLQREGRIIGVIQVLNAIGKPAFEEEDLEAFVAYANLTATAIEKLRALERTRQQERVERDLAIAAEIQKELLADALPSHLPGAEFSAFTRPATIVGGDFYMVTRVPERGVFFAIGDVAGKGIAASLLMAQVLSSLEFVFWHAKDPADTLAELNAHLGERIVRGMFVTALAGLLDPESGRLLLASAGHPAPLAVSGGAARPVPLDPGLPLGIRCGSQYQLSENRLARGEWLVTFTDGLTESRNGTSDFESQIASVAAGGGSPRDIVERLVAAEQAHRGAAEQRDDLTILVGGPSV